MTVNSVDIAGNTGSFNSSVNYIFDFTAPAFTSLVIDATTVTPLDFTDPTLAWSATDGVAIDHYEVNVNGGGFTVQTSPYTILASIVSLNTVIVRAYDTAGNTTDTTISFYPIVVITAPTTVKNSNITNTTITVT